MKPTEPLTVPNSEVPRLSGLGFRIAALCFTVIIPTVATMIWDRIDPPVGYGIIGASAAIGVAALVIARWSAKRKQGRITAKVPNLRVANSEQVLGLFRGPERQKLIALLEGGHIQAWARPIAKGQTPAGKDTDLLILEPGAWSKYDLEPMPKLRDDMRAQTFLKTKDKGYPFYYDVWFNKERIAEVWPRLRVR